jgi:acyl-coenzyme A synthetase/AMP-(fatty) acid ligase
MMPHVYVAMEEALPKNHGGKICKRTLREKYLTLENKDK